MSLFSVQISYHRYIGAWTDLYIVRADNKDDAESKLLAFASLDDFVCTATAEELDLYEPFLVAETI